MGKAWNSTLNQKSKTNLYYTSDGEGITQGVLDSRIRKAKGKRLEMQFDEYGYNFCQDCADAYLAGDTSINVNACLPIDCSHDISVQKCKDNHCVEKAYDVNNITPRGRNCHRKHDGSEIASPPKIDDL